MRLVLDTCVMVSAMRSAKGASRQLLRAVLQGHMRPLVSVPLFLEYEAVMTRQNHLKALGATVDDVAAILDAVAANAEEVRIWFLTRPVTRDRNDDMVLEVAVNGHADALVTENVADFREGAARHGITLMKPGEAFEAMKGVRS